MFLYFWCFIDTTSCCTIMYEINNIIIIISISCVRIALVPAQLVVPVSRARSSPVPGVVASEE